MKIKIPKISQQNKILLCSFLFLMVVYILFGIKTEKVVAKYNPIYADTLIPKGYGLIPVELANADTVSALMDQFGVVDLFTGTLTARGNKKIASRVKILRAPLNPNQYAVMVPEGLSQTIMNASGPFWAVVQNRDAQQATYKEPTNHTVRIEYHQPGADQ